MQAHLFPAASHFLQNNPELEAVWKLLQYFWQRHYQGVWQALTAFQWSPQLQPLIEAIAVKTREELIELIGTAYSTVRPSKVASICGVTEHEALAGGYQQPQAPHIHTPLCMEPLHALC